MFALLVNTGKPCVAYSKAILIIILDTSQLLPDRPDLGIT